LLNAKIREYWEEQAQRYSQSPAATTNDVHLRELEISTFVSMLRELSVEEGSVVLDVGCGDGFSTIRLARAFPDLRFTGVDFSKSMIKNALSELTSYDFGNRVTFLVGDVNDLEKSVGNSRYSVVLSDRCLINLGTLEQQTHAIANIAARVKPAGYYIAIENFIEGHDNMNTARATVGLPAIPVRWHNLYFREQDFRRAAEPFFGSILFHDFSSSYYFATRVIYSAMCKMRGEEPDYDHEIHRLAVQLPSVGEFSPIRLAVMRRNSVGTSNVG
jgi:ubiquinone/menaquinone biosynthesis C-methylase UbiE